MQCTMKQEASVMSAISRTKRHSHLWKKCSESLIKSWLCLSSGVLWKMRWSHLSLEFSGRLLSIFSRPTKSLQRKRNRTWITSMAQTSFPMTSCSNPCFTSTFHTTSSSKTKWCQTNFSHSVTTSRIRRRRWEHWLRDLRNWLRQTAAHRRPTQT
jgi:hypothetical protein